MAVGEQVRKWTWLLDNVEVRGIVKSDPLPDGDDIGGDDFFDIVVDKNYRHLVAYAPGSKGKMHCETYTYNITENSSAINRVEPYPIPSKGGDPFIVLDPSTGQRRNLQVGDHVRVIGRWVIENGHPVDRFGRGFYNVGSVYMEFHPFRWDDLRLITSLNPASDANIEILSLAAPIYEMVYPSSWAANRWGGVGDKIFVSDNAGNYHNDVSATMWIHAPALPTGHNPRADLISYTEEILLNGTGLPVDQVRTINVVNDGILVNASISAPLTVSVDSMRLATFNDPATFKSIFQARYSVRWLAIPPKDPKEKETKENKDTKEHKDQKESKDDMGDKARHKENLREKDRDRVGGSFGRGEDATMMAAILAARLSDIEQRLATAQINTPAIDLGAPMLEIQATTAANNTCTCEGVDTPLQATLGGPDGWHDTKEMLTLLSNRLGNIESHLAGLQTGMGDALYAQYDGLGDCTDPTEMLTLLSNRLENIESQLAIGQSFITQEQRPELGGDALREPKEQPEADELPE